jgi:hypothetical protein
MLKKSPKRDWTYYVFPTARLKSFFSVNIYSPAKIANTLAARAVNSPSLDMLKSGVSPAFLRLFRLQPVIPENKQ